jgi:hypothetical protein
MATTISGSSGVTFPAGGTDNVAGAGVGTTDTQTLTNKTLSTGLVMGASVITSGTSQASTSGTSINFTSIPSWVKQITVMFSGVSTSGTSALIIQLGTGATPTYTTSGYLGTTTTQNGTTDLFTTGYRIVNSNAAASVWHGNTVITNVTGNTWSESSVLGNSNAGGNRMSGGSIPLAAALTAVRITTENGTDTFDAGTINILYE